MKTYQGSCLCGSIRYQVKNLLPQMGHCHCSMCRKFHGAAYSTYGEVATKDFQWLSGEEFLQSYQAQNGTVRKFCGQCGSSLIFEASDHSGEIVEFALATLDSDIAERPDAHIYTESKVEWLEIKDNLPCYKAGRDSELE